MVQNKPLLSCVHYFSREDCLIFCDELHFVRKLLVVLEDLVVYWHGGPVVSEASAQLYVSLLHSLRSEESPYVFLSFILQEKEGFCFVEILEFHGFLFSLI